MKLKNWFALEKKPHKGLLLVEWATMAYIAFTLILITILSTKMHHPDILIGERVRVIAMTFALWLVYRIVPCRVTRMVRVAAQAALLGMWYPDTYELNRVLPNLDHVFAAWDQWLCGFQPALLFCEKLPGVVWSEAFNMGYFSYYPMIAFTLIYYLGWHCKEFERCAFVVMASFFTYFVIFDLLPVVGPTFYYKAVGVKQIVAGVFPDVHYYFNTHQECLPTPGNAHGVFYNLVEIMKGAGERPTAAFPSSHVGVSTVLMLLVAHTRNWKLLLGMLPFYVLLCCATVYIQAHYLVDALAGLVTGVVIYLVLMLISKKSILQTKV